MGWINGLEESHSKTRPTQAAGRHPAPMAGHGCPLRPSLRLQRPRPGLPVNRGLSLTWTRSSERPVAARDLPGPAYSD